MAEAIMSNRNIIVPMKIEVTVKLTPEQLAEQVGKFYDSEFVSFFNELVAHIRPSELGEKITSAMSRERTDKKMLDRSARYLLRDLAEIIRDNSEADNA
ncbi:hypothetical protein IM876_09160 [Serratia plymuthica]|nr:hypothetical protein [Serratia plymuthica]